MLEIDKLAKEVVYGEFYFKARTKLIFPIEKFKNQNFEDEEFEKGKIILRCRFYMGLLSIEGFISVGLPPTEEGIKNMYEHNRPAGKWDWWRIFNVYTRLNKKSKDDLTLQFYNIPYSLFEVEPFLTIHEFNLNNYKNLVVNNFKSNYTDEEEIKGTFTEFFKLLKIEFEAELIDKPKDIK